MSKQRPIIPPPVMTPPAAQQALADASAPPQSASVPAPAPPTVPDRSWTVNSLCVVLVNPIIDLTEAVWLKHAYPHVQTKRLEPARATVAHGLILIEELSLAIPLQGASIRTAVKEKA